MKTTDYDDEGLLALMKALDSKNAPIARVGILKGKTSRSESGQTNADIGLTHELGLGVPQRSFLRVPLIDNMQDYLKKAGFFTKESMARIIKEKSLLPVIERVAITANRVVLDAFETSGFGKWKPSNMKYKNVKQTLVESQQLRDSISWDAK